MNDEVCRFLRQRVTVTAPLVIAALPSGLPALLPPASVNCVTAVRAQWSGLRQALSAEASLPLPSDTATKPSWQGRPGPQLCQALGIPKARVKMGAPWALQLPVHSPSSAPKGRGEAASWPPSPRKMRSESRGSVSVKGPGPPQGFPGAQLPSHQKQNGDTGGLGVPAQRPPAPPSQSPGLPEAGENGPRFSGAGRPAPSQPL